MSPRAELELPVAPERAFSALLDVPRVARALPGASVEAHVEAGVWRGRLPLGGAAEPVTWAGTLRLVDVDEDERTASWRVEGRAEGGEASAAGRVTVRVVVAGGGGSRLLVESDVRAGGADTARADAPAILAAVARGLERELAEDRPRPAAPTTLRRAATPPAGTPRSAPMPPAATSRAHTARRTALERGGLVLAGLVAGLLLGRAVWG